MLKIFCYLTEVGAHSDYISIEDAAKRCSMTVEDLLKAITEFKKDGWNVFINYDQLSANK